MIGELEMRAGKLDLGHVTGDAQTLSDWAGFVVAAFLFFRLRNRRRFQARRRPVASETFWVVKCLVRRWVLMWIVTSGASQSHICRVVSAAGEHAIRLEANRDQTAEQLV